jgi:hypothetical protein
VAGKPAAQVVPTPPGLLIATRIVAALDAANMHDAATIARKVANLPPRVLTPDEQFVAVVRELVTTGAPVGFNCATADECDKRQALVMAIEAVDGGRRYRVRVDGNVPTRLEVSLS